MAGAPPPEPVLAAMAADMPTVIHATDIDDTYILPPIRYPDGQVYIKLGGDPNDVPALAPGELQDWFRSGGSEDVGEPGASQRLDP